MTSSEALMTVQALRDAAGAALIDAQSATTGSGRLGAIVAGLVSLVGVLLGGLALARAAGRIGTGNARLGSIAALVVGLTGVVLGGLHLARSTGGFGTGNGRAGAIVAIVVGLIGMALGALALARSRRPVRTPTDGR